MTNYDIKLLQITVPSLQITARNYYKLHQNVIKAGQIFPNYRWLLQIALTFIINYRSFQIITNYVKNKSQITEDRGDSRTAATSKMECFVIIVNGF